MSAFLSSIPLADLREAHLTRLIDDSVAESRDLDFKRDTYGSDRNAKREFLKDVTALANTFGGHLVIGMDEDDSIASRVMPITGLSVDDEKQRLENLMRDTVAPNLIGVQIQHVPVADGFVLVIRVPRSWNPPHRVEMGDDRFYGRNSSGVYPMDVEQLRAVFLGASESERQVQRFRAERVDLTLRQMLPVTLQSPAQSMDGTVAVHAYVAVHLMPFNQSARRLSMGNVETLRDEFAPLGFDRSRSVRPNADGMMFRTPAYDSGTYEAFTQVFRDGRLETVKAMLSANGGINPDHLQHGLIYSLPRYLLALAKLGFGPPFSVMLSVIGVGGRSLIKPHLRTHPCDRSVVLIEPIFVYSMNLDGSWHRQIRPLLDDLWNAFGIMECPDFNERGEWASR